MGVSKAANAVLVKARAMYGNRLTSQNYSELTSCRTVNEIAAYLKSRTAYADVFESVPIGTVHRRQLERAVHDKLNIQFAGLCRYEQAIGDKFYEYFIIRSDVEILLHTVRYLNRGHIHEHPTVLPDFFQYHSKLDEAALLKAATFPQLMHALKGSPYRKLFEPFEARGGDPDYFAMELMLTKFMHSEIEKLIKRSFGGKAFKELSDLLRMRRDFLNIISIYRFKKIAQRPGVLIRDVLIPNDSLLTDEQFESMINAVNADEVMRILKESCYGKDYIENESVCIEQTFQKMLYRRCRKTLRFSTNSGVVVVCYITLMETEVQNLVHIIEGIRYNLPAGEINRLLVGADDE